MEPVYAVWDRPTYSNLGFSILGIAMARAFNQSLDEVFQSQVFEPFNMTSSSLSHPPKKNGVIPVQSNEWEFDFGSDAAAGAMYSSTTDIMNFHRALFRGSVLPPHV